MSNIYPIGTVLERQNSKIIVMGYQIYGEGKESYLLYKCASYPVGYTDEKSLFYIKSNIECEVVKEGYQDHSYVIVNKLINEILEDYNVLGYNKVNEINEMILNKLNSMIVEGDK